MTWPLSPPESTVPGHGRRDGAATRKLPFWHQFNLEQDSLGLRHFEFVINP